MIRSVAVIAVLACFTVAILTACGSSDSAGSSTADQAAVTNAETTAPVATSTKTTTPAPEPAASATSKSSPDQNSKVVAPCHKAFDPLLAQLRKLDRITDGTPRFTTYRAATNKLLAVNLKTNATGVSASCSRAVGDPVTLAYVTHLGAIDLWKKCRKRHNCAKVMPKIEAQWRDASKAIATASKGFATVTTT